jgi:hypothetical protein
MMTRLLALLESARYDGGAVAFRRLALPVAAALGLVASLPRARAEKDVAAVHWEEHFDHRLNWVDPFDHPGEALKRVYSIQRGDDNRTFLHARHDRTAGDGPPAMHFGRAFQTDPAPLEKVQSLKWRWRVLRHPSLPAEEDAWLDCAGGVYVVIKQPTLLAGGKGFKFGWLVRSGSPRTHQHGLLQVELRHDPAGAGWKEESVDLCALYKQEYGSPCEGQKVLYIGVVTDADGTKSVAEADYADFELRTRL